MRVELCQCPVCVPSSLARELVLQAGWSSFVELPSLREVGSLAEHFGIFLCSHDQVHVIVGHLFVRGWQSSPLCTCTLSFECAIIMNVFGATFLCLGGMRRGRAGLGCSTRMFLWTPSVSSGGESQSWLLHALVGGDARLCPFAPLCPFQAY